MKKLVTGQLSLSMTFWGWGFCGGIAIGMMGMAGVSAGYVSFVPLAWILKTLLFCAVLSGITFILRRKFSLLGSLAFFVILTQVIVCIYMIVNLASLLFA